MNKLNRRDFLKRIGALPFIAIPLVGALGAEKEVGVTRRDCTAADFDSFTAEAHGAIIDWETTPGAVEDWIVFTEDEIRSYVKVSIGEDAPKYIRVY